MSPIDRGTRPSPASPPRGWGARAGSIPVPASLAEIGGYIRPAGRSLGLVIDTPQLDTQVAAVEEGLEAARRLARWWNHHADTLKS